MGLRAKDVLYLNQTLTLAYQMIKNLPWNNDLTPVERGNLLGQIQISQDILKEAVRDIEIPVVPELGNHLKLVKDSTHGTI